MTFLGMPGSGNLRGDEPFPTAARRALRDTQMRRNVGHATHTIRTKRLGAVSECVDWEELREAGSEIKDDVLARLPELLEELEANVTARGGVVHWARDAHEANAIVTSLVRATGADEVVKVKSMATQEIGLNEHLEAHGITAVETDLAELIVQLGHILVPAIHRNRAEIREIFTREMPDAGELTDDPRVLAMAARRHLRRKFLSAKVAVSGANFGVAETGTLAVVESEGNGRMCLTLPRTLITVMGIEKVVPTFADLEVFMQLLPRSSTAERMNPYTSMWTGVHQRPHQGARRPGGSRRAQMHPLQRVPERVSGVRAHRRARLRVDLSRPDRRHPESAADRHHRSPRPERVAAVRVIAVRGVFRRLPGAHRHPVDPGSSAGRSGRQRTRRCAGRRAGRDDGGSVGDGVLAPVRPRREGAVGRPDRGRWRSPDHRPALAGLTLDRQPRSARTPTRDVPAVVGPHPGTAFAMSNGDAKTAILQRIRAALAESGAAPLALDRRYDRRPLRGPGDVDRFTETVDEYRARVHRIDEPDIAATIAGLLAPGGHVVAPADLPRWWVDGLEVAFDDPADPLPIERLDEVDAVVTGCALGIAATGTIVLDGGTAQGRRALTLVPDHHICIVRADQVVDTVPQGFAALDPRRPLTFISGPSATSDIELNRVEGVHGPRTLDVLVIG